MGNEDTNDKVLSGGPYGNNQLIQVHECVSKGCYEFVIFDSAGDGICCSYGEGYYTITVDKNVLQESNGTYNSSEHVKFCSIETASPASDAKSQPSKQLFQENDTDDEGDDNNNECTSIWIEIKTDAYPSEISWNIDDISGNSLYSGGSYTDTYTIYSEDICMVSTDCYIFSIF